MSEDRDQLKQVLLVAKQRAGNKLDDIGWWFIVRGVIAIGLAIVALFWPEKTIGVLVNLLGVYMLFDGAVGAMGAVRSGGQRGFPVFASVSIAIGAILLLWTGLSVRLFLTLVGVWALLQGAGMYLSNQGTDSDAESRRLFATIGAVMAIIGLILIIWPGTGVVAISWLLAFVALLLGCVMLFLASRLKRLSTRIENHGKFPNAQN